VWYILGLLRMIIVGSFPSDTSLLLAQLLGAVIGGAVGSYIFAVILIALWVGLTSVYTRVKNTLTNRG